MPNNDRASIYARITEQIVAAIERGVEVGRMPWHHDGSAIYRPANVGPKKPYRGINTLALWASAEAKGYPTGLWGTFKQWFELGAVVRKGERASAVVLWKQVEKPDAEDTEKKRFFARGYSVFNVAQVDGHEPEAIPTLPESERLAHAAPTLASRRVIARSGPRHATTPSSCSRRSACRAHSARFSRPTSPAISGSSTPWTRRRRRRHRLNNRTLRRGVTRAARRGVRQNALKLAQIGDLALDHIEVLRRERIDVGAAASAVGNR